MARTDFVERSPLTREALAFADERHAGQKRELDGDIPFVTHPIEAACLLHEAGHPDEVVAAGVLHDVVEDTDADPGDLEERFGPEVARLVAAVSDDSSIDDDARRRAALRDQVAEAGERAAAIFAADKVSKTRELRIRMGRNRRLERADRGKLEHYEASLEMLRRRLPGHSLVDQLASELDALHALRGGHSAAPEEKEPDRLANRGQERGHFERFAERATTLVSGSIFFVACVGLVLLWLGTFFVFGDADTWQLVINTVTTIVTFLLVALLQNSQRRSAQALHEKLDAIADGLADLMEHQIDRDPEDLTGDIDDLRAAVGLQHRR